MQLSTIAGFLCLYQVPVYLGLRVAQRRGTPRQFILVSGSEGSGTAMMTRILAECETCLGVPSNWRKEDLSSHAQGKYEHVDLGRLADRLYGVTMSLWNDSQARSYIKDGVDARDPSSRSSNRREVSTIVEEALASTNLSTLVYHRSMPFATRHNTPFLEDLPFFAPNGVVHAVIVNRFQPASWLSHASPNDYEPFLARIEKLMAGRETAHGVNVHFVSYEHLVCKPASALEELAHTLHDVNVKHLLSAPSLRYTETVAHHHDQDQQYLERLEQYEHKWEAEKDQYPACEKFQQAGQTQCEDQAKLSASYLRDED